MLDEDGEADGAAAEDEDGMVGGGTYGRSSKIINFS